MMWAVRGAVMPQLYAPYFLRQAVSAAYIDIFLGLWLWSWRRGRAGIRGCRRRCGCRREGRPDLVVESVKRAVYFLVHVLDHCAARRIGTAGEIALNVIEQCLIGFAARFQS